MSTLGSIANRFVPRRTTDKMKPAYKFNLKAPNENKLTAPQQATFEQDEDKVGLLVSDEFEKATSRCRDKVKKIAKECRERNRKFR